MRETYETNYEGRFVCEVMEYDDDNDGDSEVALYLKQDCRMKSAVYKYFDIECWME